MNLYNRILKANSTTPYALKDLNKAKKANKFIGRGSINSSTNKYKNAAGDLANTGNYTSEDVVFISAEGDRKSRIEVDFEEIKKAIEAGASFVTDSIFDRNRPYNVGERRVADFLKNNGYNDNGTGDWKKQN